VVDVEVVGPKLLSWLPWDHRHISLPIATPTPPHLLTVSVMRRLSGSVQVKFSSSVAKVSYELGGQTHTISLTKPASRVTLDLPKATPGTKGSLFVSASARAWESPGPTQSLTWHALLYLTVASSTTASVAPTSPLTVKFAEPLSHSDLSKWRILPSTPGHFTELSPTRYQFTPSGSTGFGPGALVAVEIPGGASGVVGANGSYLAHATKIFWTTPDGSVLRLQELLAQEGYLPVSWTSSSAPIGDSVAAEDQTIYNPLAGTFHWKYPNIPQTLHTLWTPGQMSVVTKGAIMQFERVNGLAVDGIAGPEVWAALIRDRVL